MRATTCSSLFDLEPVDLTSDRITVVTSYHDWQRASQLLIKNLTSQDFGQYGCFAENEVGTDLGRILLRQQNRINLLAVVAAVAAVSGVAVLAAIALYFRLRTKNSDDYKTTCEICR